jgi:hypothetical protein
MEVVGPRKPTLALPLPLPRPSIVDRQRTGRSVRQPVRQHRQVCGAAEAGTTDTGAGVDAGEVELHSLYTGRRAALVR